MIMYVPVQMAFAVLYVAEYTTRENVFKCKLVNSPFWAFSPNIDGAI